MTGRRTLSARRSDEACRRLLIRLPGPYGGDSIALLEELRMVDRVYDLKRESNRRVGDDHADADTFGKRLEPGHVERG
jgi:hypothetical protein